MPLIQGEKSANFAVLVKNTQNGISIRAKKMASLLIVIIIREFYFPSFRVAYKIPILV